MMYIFFFFLIYTELNSQYEGSKTAVLPLDQHFVGANDVHCTVVRCVYCTHLTAKVIKKIDMFRWVLIINVTFNSINVKSCDFTLPFFLIENRWYVATVLQVRLWTLTAKTRTQHLNRWVGALHKDLTTCTFFGRGSGVNINENATKGRLDSIPGSKIISNLIRY